MTKQKNKGGRPVTIDARRVNVTLDKRTIEEARKLGDGNISEGIRLAVAAWVESMGR